MGIADFLLGNGQPQDEPQFGLSDNEKQGLLWGALISAGMAAATGANPREAILNGLSGGAAAYSGGMNDTLAWKKKILDQERERQLIESARARDISIAQHYGTEAEKNRMAIDAAKKKAAYEEKINALAPEIYKGIYNTPVPESQSQRLLRLGMVDPVSGQNLLNLTEKGSEGEAMTRQFLGNNPAQMSTWGQQNPTRANMLLYDLAMSPDKGNVVSNMLKTVFPDKGEKPMVNIEGYGELPADIGYHYIQKPSTERKLTPYVDQKGKTVLVNEYDPASEQRIQDEGLKPVPLQTADIRSNTFNTIPNMNSGTFFNRKTKTWQMSTENGVIDLTSEQARKMNLGAKTELAEDTTAARNRYGMRGASIITAADVFNKEAPELITLRNIVQAKNLLPTGGWKDLEALNQWLGMKASDPDVAELKKKTKLTADLLQRTIGGSQGGQWAFEVAADILDPSLAPQAFKRIWTSHSMTLTRMANEYKHLGENKGDTVPYTGEETQPSSTKGMPAGMKRKSW